MNIIQDLKDIRSSKKDLRKFSLIIGMVFFGWGGIFLLREGSGYLHFFLIALIFLLAGLFFPFLIKPPYKAAAIFTVLWRWLFAKIFLYAIFFLGFTLTNFTAKLFRKRFLDLKLDKNTDSYWIFKKKNEFQKDDYERQF